MRSSPEILAALENESIEIIRETAASFRNPVFLYSIGKDSSVLLHLIRKAFFPAPVPFPMLHIDTTWKFKEMLTFRDEMAVHYGIKLMVIPMQMVFVMVLLLFLLMHRNTPES